VTNESVDSRFRGNDKWGGSFNPVARFFAAFRMTFELIIDCLGDFGIIPANEKDTGGQNK